MRALIDADSIVYKYASINQDTCIWDDSNPEDVMSTVTVDYNKARDDMITFIDEILVTTKTTDYQLVLSPSRTFRYDISADYKANRRKPKVALMLLAPLRKYMLDHMGAILFDNVEADDVCVSRMYAEPGEYVLCHIDKDLNQAYGSHYNYNTQEKYIVDKVEADYWFWKQSLEGDSVDGIKGCPRVGKVKAAKLLASLKSPTDEQYWEAILGCYENAKCDEKFAVVQAQLVYMLRDFNEDTEEFTVWTPEGGLQFSSGLSLSVQEAS
jgi:DNA polymerase-1